MWLGINWTDIIKAAVTASINSIAVYLSIRYVGRIADRMEKNNEGRKKGPDVPTLPPTG